MLKIVDVHTSPNPEGEYVVLQNHGTLTVSLRGCALCSPSYLLESPQIAAQEMYVFREDVSIKPYGRVVLFTGHGRDGWHPTTDGKACFVAYWGREQGIWAVCEQVHLLQIASSCRVAQPELALSGGV